MHQAGTSDRKLSRRWLFAPAVAAAAIVVGACSSSSSPKGLTVGTANVPGVGTVLVNAKDGKTLYMLTSDQGGNQACTDANGCTKVWPDTGLPSGVKAATAGAGVDASKLSTIKSSEGELYPTYAGWPLYEYVGDTASGQANGQGIKSFGGTWMTLTPAGTPVTAAAAAPTASSSQTSPY